MYHKILQLLNVKPSESTLVRELFTIQFFLGIATAFLFVSSLQMFISNYEITVLPVSYIVSACLLLVFNRMYSYLDEKLSSPKLLQVVILFSAGSIFLFWLLLNVFPFKQLPLIIASWYLLIYMVVGYAFWGMASIIFNVRESKRLFSIVGAGDIPAKMLGYSMVPLLVHFINIKNLLWVSLISFMIAYVLLRRFQSRGLLVDDDPNSITHAHDSKPAHAIHTSGFLSKFFDNRLVFSIALLSLVSYVVFSFIDFTFLSDIKLKYHKGEQIATFIGVFFAIGRFLAIAIKILFSSRMISRIGLTNALLLTPLLLLVIDLYIIISGDRFISHLYIFGFMVLLTEVLRSTLQEPVFFILFQPLKPHDRLRGHLLAKGHTLPFALLGVGGFLVLYFQQNHELPIFLVGELLVALLFIWIASVFIIKKQYLATLITSLKKGYFTGSELFLNDSAVTKLLLTKTESKKPLEVIHSLNLLERSGYTDIYKLLLKNLQNPVKEIRQYVLTRIMANKMTGALPIITRQVEKISDMDDDAQQKLIKAYYFLNRDIRMDDKTTISSLPSNRKKAAMEGLLDRQEEETEKMVIDNLVLLAKSSKEDKMLALDIMMDCECKNYTEVLQILIEDADPVIYKKAIEASGKVKNLQLLPKVFEVAAAKKAYPSLKKSIIYYGDDIFTEKNLQPDQLPENLHETIIKAAGNIKGEHSTRFLLDTLQKKVYTDEVIEALWLKKGVLSNEDHKLLENWASEKTEQSKHKLICYHNAAHFKNLTLLQQAILMEIKKDVQVLLKGFSMLYDSEKVNRVIELIRIGNTSKISNAIEILEILIPKRFFTQLNSLVELVDDVQHKKELLTKTNVLQASSIIAEVIKSNKANFSEWTRSMACYEVLKLKKNEVSLPELQAKDLKDSHLFNETRNYVLSILN